MQSMPHRAALDLAITTMAASSNGHAMCGLLKWCSQASTLAALVPRSEVAILTPHDRLDDCPKARLLRWDSELQRRFAVYTNRSSIVRDRRAAASMALVMQKLQVLSLREYRAVLFTDWDVDPVPSVSRARVAWQRHFPRFLDAPQTLVIASPDERAPFNAGVFLAKPASSAYELALRWLGNGHDAVWDPELGFDLVGRPRALGTPGSRHFNFNRTAFMRRDRWDVGLGSSTDQGLLFYETPLFLGRCSRGGLLLFLHYPRYHLGVDPT